MLMEMVGFVSYLVVSFVNLRDKIPDFFKKLGIWALQFSPII